MKLLLIGLSIFIGIPSVQAMKVPTSLPKTNAYQLKMDLVLNGKLLSSPELVIREHGDATITQKTDQGQIFYFEITAGEPGKTRGAPIIMKFVVGTIGQGGQKVVLSQPRVSLVESHPTKVLVKESKTSELALSLTVHRKQL